MLTLIVYVLIFMAMAITERLAFHKQSGAKPLDVLPFLLDIYQPFSQADFEEAISIPQQKVDFKVVPSGREIFGEMLKALDECAKKLAFALLPIVESYPMPFYRVEEQ
jgi:hypothetical protein